MLEILVYVSSVLFRKVKGLSSGLMAIVVIRIENCCGVTGDDAIIGRLDHN